MKSTPPEESRRELQAKLDKLEAAYAELQSRVEQEYARGRREAHSAMSDRMEWTVTDNAKQRMKVDDLQAQAQEHRALYVARTRELDALQARNDRLAEALRLIHDEHPDSGFADDTLHMLKASTSHNAGAAASILAARAALKEHEENR